MFENYFKYTFLIHSLLDETMPIGLTAHEIFCWSTTFSSYRLAKFGISIVFFSNRFD
jgi:hypothetical protein